MPLRQHSPTVHILGVGKSFFGLEQGDKNEPGQNSIHYDFGIAHFNADEIRAALRKRNFRYSKTKRSSESFKFRDPDGFLGPRERLRLRGPRELNRPSIAAYHYNRLSMVKHPHRRSYGSAKISEDG